MEPFSLDLGRLQMSGIQKTELTDRQRREVDYHRELAKTYQGLLQQPLEWAVLEHPTRKWWNAYWQMYAYLVKRDLKDKHVLIVGCGFGDDAFYLAKLSAQVSAFDLSADSLAIAKRIADREGLTIAFEQMPAEALRYGDNSFDYVIARDILHHVDIPRAMKEIVRVSKPDALFIANEIYSHSITDRIRHSTFVSKILYPRLQRFIYGEDRPYITEDERKLNENDLKEIKKLLRSPDMDKYFDFVVTRIVPSRFKLLAMIDRVFLLLLLPIAEFLAGRVLFAARISK